MNHWRVPVGWFGDVVAIFASGPSMSAKIAVAVDRAGIKAIAVNSTFRLVPWATALYAADAEWWQHPHNTDALAFAGTKLSCQDVGHGVQVMRNGGVTGFDEDTASIRTGGNGGYQALHIAIHAAPSRILLFGYDMRGCHWHGPHPEGLKQTHPAQYVTWCARFPALADVAKRRGIEVLNCCPGSALECFPRVDPLEAIAEAVCVER